MYAPVTALPPVPVLVSIPPFFGIPPFVRQADKKAPIDETAHFPPKSFFSPRLSTLAALAALGLAAVPAAHAQRSLYVANYIDSTIEEFNGAGVGTKFNVSGDVNEPAGLAFSPAAVPEASTTVSLGLLLSLGLGGMMLAAKRRTWA